MTLKRPKRRQFDYAASTGRAPSSTLEGFHSARWGEGRTCSSRIEDFAAMLVSRVGERGQAILPFETTIRYLAAHAANCISERSQAQDVVECGQF